jgi:isoquinoline 1-oxidoreductase beta subunit
VVAQVADVSVDAGGAIRVDRICCAIDCGTPVNPGLIRQQVDSAIVFGLSAALHGESSFEHGQAVQTGFGDQPVLGMAACPRIELSIVPSQASPQGVGEPPLPPVAPAVANAVFAATGQRLRTLPLRLV